MAGNGLARRMVDMADLSIADCTGNSAGANVRFCDEIRMVLRDELQQQFMQHQALLERLLEGAPPTDAELQSKMTMPFIVHEPTSPSLLDAPIAQSEQAPSVGDEAVADAAVPNEQLRSSRATNESRWSINAEDRARRAAAESVSDLSAACSVNQHSANPRQSCNVEIAHLFSKPAKDELTCFQKVVQSHLFEMFFAAAILTNSLFVGGTVHYAVSNPSSPVPLSFYIVQHFYALVFLTELLLRLYSDGFQMFWNDQWYWNCLDLFIVATSLCEVVFDLIFLTQESSTVGTIENMSSVRIVRIIRITRLIRIFRITRIMRFVRALRTLVFSILCTLKSLIWAMLLLLLIVYVFGIIFTQAASDYLVGKGIYVDALPSAWAPPDEIISLRRYWGSLSTSMFTLFKAIAGGLSWQEAVDCLELAGVAMVLIFLFFIAFAYFAVLNVVTGVFCQSAIESSQHDKEVVVQNELAKRKSYEEKITQLFRGIDTNDDGCITLQEFENHLQDEQVIAYFDALELGTSDAWSLFKLLDSDKTNTIDIEQFVTGCANLKGNARGIDMAKLIHESQWMNKRVTTFMSETEMRFVAICSLLDRIIGSKGNCQSFVDAVHVSSSASDAGGVASPLRQLSAARLADKAASKAPKAEPLSRKSTGIFDSHMANIPVVEVDETIDSSECILVDARAQSPETSLTTFEI